MERAISTTAAVEEWRPVVGYEGWYEVSNFGRVRSLDRYVTIKRKNGEYTRIRYGVILVPEIINGYENVLLYKDCKRVLRRVHRLVAEAFIPNPNNYPLVNHKDENKKNNAIWNLEWCTQLYNINYGTRTKRVSIKLGRRIEQLTLNGDHIAFYHSISEAQRKTKNKNIAYTLKRGYIRSGGYRWRYVDN